MEDPLMVDESQAIPEEPEQGLDWLEQLASERGLDVEIEPSSDMSMMSQPPEPAIEEPQQEPEIASEAPDWLQEMQTGEADEPTLEQELAQTEVEEAVPAVEAPAAPIEAPVEAGLDTEAPPWLEEMAEDPDQIADDTGSFADVAAQLSAETAEPVVEPAEPQSELDWLSSADAEPVEAQAAVDGDLSATDWLSSMADDTGDTITAPQVMMAEQDQAPVEEPVVTPPADVQELPPQPVQPTPDLAEEIAAEVSEFWTAEDGEGPVTPEPVSEEIAAPSQAGSPLETAHLGLEHGDIEAAVAIYAGLIQENQELGGIIAKLSEVLSRDPNQALLWQTLGDAYMNNDQLNEAIEAYQKGTEVA
jgi:tetratricopeptide (TPR) repeat protein